MFAHETHLKSLLLLGAVIFKLKTNRHYGMLGKIPSQDIPWGAKRNQAVFRGTLTGFLALSSQFSVSTRSSNATLLSNQAARSKCQELSRCRLVYDVQQFYQKKSSADRIVDARLVPPQLQHIDIPETIDGVALFGERMSKQEVRSVNQMRTSRISPFVVSQVQSHHHFGR